MAELSSMIAKEILKTPGASTVGGVTTAAVGGVQSDQVVHTTEPPVASNATEGQNTTTEGTSATLVLPTEADDATVLSIDDVTGPSSSATTVPTTTTGSPVSTDTAERDAITVTISPPKTTEELIAARAIKRIAKKTALRQAAQEFIARGDAYMEIKSFKAASHQFLQAIELCRTDPEYFIKLAGSYRKLKWYEEAAHAATRALTLNPQNSEARYVRGVARLEQRLLKPAKIDFETVLEHDPTHLLARAALTEVTHFISTSSHLGAHTLGPSTIDDIVKDVDFSFPAYDFDTEGVMDDGELSDSSDCGHLGNGVPCRFYNHDGCTRGPAECQFSHAPDERSVRDDLGKNICVYHILSSCKFGPLKCIYSHDKSALPKRGWWTSPEQIERVRGIMEVAEKKAKEQREREAERWKARMKGRNVAKDKSKAKPPATGVDGQVAEAEAEAETVAVAAKEGETAVAHPTEGTQESTPVVAENGEEQTVQTPRSAGPRTHRRGKPRKPQHPKADGVAPAPIGDDEPPKSAIAGEEKEKEKEEKKTRVPRRRVTNNRRKKPSASAPQASTSNSGQPQAADISVKNEVQDKKDSAGFTDYKPNGHPPADNVADVSVILSY